MQTSYILLWIETVYLFINAYGLYTLAHDG